MAEDTSTTDGGDAEDTSTTTDTAKPGSTSNDQPDVPPAVKAALRKANKEAETLRLRLKELEDRDKSEAEKATERLTAAEKRAANLEGELLRLQVAGEKGLTPAQAKRLVGSSREELEADADELLATFGAAQQKNGSGNGEQKNVRPKAAMRQVPVTDGGEQKDANAQMNDWLRSAARK